MQLTITICKVLLQIPILISQESKQQLLKNSPEIEDTQVQGILNRKVENALQMAVGMLEAGEKYTGTWY